VESGNLLSRDLAASIIIFAGAELNNSSDLALSVPGDHLRANGYSVMKASKWLSPAIRATTERCWDLEIGFPDMWGLLLKASSIRILPILN
jgi:hypothetical protein